MDVLSAVKNYTFKEGEPCGLIRVYQINTPDSGFSPYYVFLKLGIENAYPFVFNREGISGKDEPYSRYNVVLKVNNQSLMPDRKYKSGYAEDSESCLGIEKLRVVQGSKNIKWFMIDALYQSESDTTEKTEEVYFYSGGGFCFSESKSVKLVANKITMEDLKNLALDKEDFEECAK
ncbi:hypothetical protein [Kosakonia sacchari]|uniref:hypothetical protein n=1 Tax=Kosakonia sacchari TaxID=1158459 RepID=UPI0015846E3B|nr:hypothetical protein [Kosakonia sacchari]MDN2485280.1 hypothetical protein [Kosakonia sacchari]NUL36764.1 hypothetical protein [Kosakonia sacchari]